MTSATCDDVARWLGRLVQIPSVTPDQGGSGEGQLAAALVGWFDELGAQTFVEEVLPGRPNVYAIRPGRESRFVAVDVHTDTVSADNMLDDPFDGRVENGRVYGRGAVDTKATLALVLALFEELDSRSTQSGPTLLIAATVDEETGTRGAPASAAWLRRRDIRPEEMIVAEPTGCVPVHGHKGVSRLTLEVKGRGAHSATPDRGANAVVAAARIVTALAAEDERLLTQPETALGHGRLTVTEIEGGEGINLVPSQCSLSVDRRLVTGEDPDEIAGGVHRLAIEQTSLPVAMQTTILQPAFFESAESRWMKRLFSWCGSAPTVVPYGTNAFAYGESAEGLAVLGPGSIDQAHGAEEWVEIGQLDRLLTLYRRWWQIEG